MPSRRSFVKQTGLASMAFLTSPTVDFLKSQGVSNVGIQLFSIPKMLSANPVAAIGMLQQMGYKELELYGPYTFSAESAKSGWKQVTGMLGFSGSGYFEKSSSEFLKLIKDSGMTTPSMHTDLDTLENDMPALAKAAHEMGHKYVVLPAIPDARRKTLDDYKKMADSFNKIGAAAKKEGIRFGYHNHGYGIKPLADGTVPLEVMLNATDPDTVFLEMDLFWTAAGGADPVALLNKYSKRYKMLHIKDMSKKATFSGDGGDASQWFALFPLMCSCGDGVLDLKNIIATSQKIGVEHYFIEQDMVANPETALKKSIDYIKTV
ncbi:MAG: sugar phosphate isomerase/epimerase [Chitinophagaceae bacterium]|uniref:sugar phosphate isomerase/epimerase family protein n=1 Tax=unclassified Paraflavitalea TaxID=2798305 RepID=UPI003D346460|nr:sugar phosphate isomerase/epimerase [Chitinophagaceae bacterium]